MQSKFDMALRYAAHYFSYINVPLNRICFSTFGHFPMFIRVSYRTWRVSNFNSESRINPNILRPAFDYGIKIVQTENRECSSGKVIRGDRQWSLPP